MCCPPGLVSIVLFTTLSVTCYCGVGHQTLPKTQESPGKARHGQGTPLLGPAERSERRFLRNYDLDDGITQGGGIPCGGGGGLGGVYSWSIPLDCRIKPLVLAHSTTTEYTCVTADFAVCNMDGVR